MLLNLFVLADSQIHYFQTGPRIVFHCEESKLLIDFLLQTRGHGKPARQSFKDNLPYIKYLTVLSKMTEYKLTMSMHS